MIADDEIDALFPKVKRAIVTITTEDGRQFTKLEDHAKGRAERPLSDAELVDKFRANAGHALTDRRLDEVVRTTFELESVSSVGDYMALLTRDRT